MSRVTSLVFVILTVKGFRVPSPFLTEDGTGIAPEVITPNRYAGKDMIPNRQRLFNFARNRQGSMIPNLASSQRPIRSVTSESSQDSQSHSVQRTPQIPPFYAIYPTPPIGIFDGILRPAPPTLTGLMPTFLINTRFMNQIHPFAFRRFYDDRPIDVYCHSDVGSDIFSSAMKTHPNLDLPPYIYEPYFTLRRSIDGGAWTVWATWSACNPLDNVQTRVRSCVYKADILHWNGCTGRALQMRPCISSDVISPLPYKFHF